MYVSESGERLAVIITKMPSYPDNELFYTSIRGNEAIHDRITTESSLIEWIEERQAYLVKESNVIWNSLND